MKNRRIRQEFASLLVLGVVSLSCQAQSASGDPSTPKATDQSQGFSIRKALLEVFTGSWCGYCPDGRVYANQVENNDSDAIVVERHYGDDMETPVSVELSNYYGAFYPSAVVNRESDAISRGSWQTSMLNSAQTAADVQLDFLDLAYYAPTRKISGTLKMTFTANLTGDFWPNVWIVEDVVTGVGSGYDQVNYDNATPGHPFSGAGNPIIGYEHKHVVRGETDGAWGRAGALPASVGFGESYSIPFVYTLDPAYDETRIHLVGVLGEYGPLLADRMILNATQARLPGKLFASGFETSL